MIRLQNASGSLNDPLIHVFHEASWFRTKKIQMDYLQDGECFLSFMYCDRLGLFSLVLLGSADSLSAGASTLTQHQVGTSVPQVVRLVAISNVGLHCSS